MAVDQGTFFEAFLRQHDAAAWKRAIDDLLPVMHEVDRNATPIWFHFFPLALADAFGRAEDPAQLARKLLIQGSSRLGDQVDSSHWFLYGHRYWTPVKAEVISRAGAVTSPSSLDLTSIVRDVARHAAAGAGVEESLVIGIAAVALMTLQQVGLSTFQAMPGTVDIPPAYARKRPTQLLAARKRDDSQGIFGLLRGIRSEYTVTFDERDPAARFVLINQQHLTTAAANDKRDHRARDPRCQEGPIPVQCRTASCGTCWVGILAGAGKLSDVEDLEARKIKEFGYINTTEAKPIIRLSCMARASGNVTIVIPPWNGIIGRSLS